MRGTVSRTLVMKDVFVPDGGQLMPRGVYFQAASRWPHMFATLSPTYMGIAQAAYDFTVQYLRGEVPGTPPVKRRMYPTKQIAVAEMRIKLEQTRALFLRLSGARRKSTRARTSACAATRRTTPSWRTPTTCAGSRSAPAAASRCCARCRSSACTATAAAAR